MSVWILCVCVWADKLMGAPLTQLVLVLALLPRIDGWIQYICISQPYMRTHSQNIHTTLHNAWYFHWHHWVSLPPSLWRSCLSWPVSFLMANLRYTTWTRPFTSTSCWPFSRGSMKNSPLSVRIRPDWKKKKDSFMSAPLPLQRDCNSPGASKYSTHNHLERGKTRGTDAGRPFKTVTEIYWVKPGFNTEWSPSMELLSN